MPRITPIDWKTLEFVFELAGFVFERQKGDHRCYVREGTWRPVVIPTYKEVDIDIIQANMRTAGLDRKTYFEYLKKCK